MVDEIISDETPLYNRFKSPTKLRLKGIKYFSQPIIVRDIAKELDFIEDDEKSSNYCVSEFREISEKDFKRIYYEVPLTKKYPPYFEKKSFDMDEFIVKTIKSLHYILKKTENRQQYEIKSFLVLLKKMLDLYGIDKTFDEVNEFYAKNAWELGFKHIPSRNPDEIVHLYDSSGKKASFSYINLD
ncbi:MAG: hypothetical protein LBT10_01160 [Methanobrevibacter sp.]|jgi:predicted RNA-binding protein|nr:hypothetical protein [Methanobrevibacter sp.]